MPSDARTIGLRDSTLREGLDTPGVRFSDAQAIEIAGALERAGVPEIEVVAPSRVNDGLERVRCLRAAGLEIPTSGLIYAAGDRCRAEIAAATEGVDRFDLLMPLSSKREPSDARAKVDVLLEALACADPERRDVGAGFPHSTQVDPDLLREIATAAVRAGARRVTIYDTNGSGDPFAVRALLERLTRDVAVPVFFHGHDDLGLATANSLAAVLGGASGLDVTVNGLGDRAGNACLEQVVIALRVRGFATGVAPEALRPVSRLVERASGVAVSKLAPVVGDFVFAHKSPGHFTALSEFEAFDPAWVGAQRRVDRGAPAAGGSELPEGAAPASGSARRAGGSA